MITVRGVRDHGLLEPLGGKVLENLPRLDPCVVLLLVGGVGVGGTLGVEVNEDGRPRLDVVVRSGGLGAGDYGIPLGSSIARVLDGVYRSVNPVAVVLSDVPQQCIHIGVVAREGLAVPEYPNLGKRIGGLEDVPPLAYGLFVYHASCGLRWFFLS